MDKDIEKTYEQWSAESFMFDEIERTADVNERLVLLYDYFRVFGEFPEYNLKNDE